jgi:hypothetical protein
MPCSRPWADKKGLVLRRGKSRLRRGRVRRPRLVLLRLAIGADRPDPGSGFPLCLERPDPVRGRLGLGLAVVDRGHGAGPTLIGRARLEMAAAGAAPRWLHHLPAGLAKLCRLPSPRLGHSRPPGRVFPGHVPAPKRRARPGRGGTRVPRQLDGYAGRGFLVHSGMRGPLGMEGVRPGLRGFPFVGAGPALDEAALRPGRVASRALGVQGRHRQSHSGPPAASPQGHGRGPGGRSGPLGRGVAADGFPAALFGSRSGGLSGRWPD